MPGGVAGDLSPDGNLAAYLDRHGLELLPADAALELAEAVPGDRSGDQVPDALCLELPVRGRTPLLGIELVGRLDAQERLDAGDERQREAHLRAEGLWDEDDDDPEAEADAEMEDDPLYQEFEEDAEPDSKS